MPRRTSSQSSARCIDTTLAVTVGTDSDWIGGSITAIGSTAGDGVGCADAGAAAATTTVGVTGRGALTAPTWSRRFHHTYAAVATSAVAVTAATVTAVRPRLPRGAASKIGRAHV